MTTWGEAPDSWERMEPVKGVAFLPRDRVVVAAGDFAGRFGTVVGLSKGAPEPFYEVQQDDGTRAVLAGSTLDSPVPNDLGQQIAWIQKWYSAQCDGDWEHQGGFVLGTLDNPGWSLEVNLEGTDLQGKPFDPISDLEPERAWLACRVDGTKWLGAGGPHMLGEILATFVGWARRHGASA